MTTRSGRMSGKMPVKFSEEYSISTQALRDTKVFDVILDVDTRVFVDPALLGLSDVPEFSGASDKVKKYFSDIITLLKHSKNRKDMFWKKADALLTFKEFTGTCFGYSQKSTNGNSIGAVLRKKILETIKELVDEGETDPALFELLSVFQENVGCDRISDLITFILADEVLSYTERVIRVLAVPSVPFDYRGNIYRICRNQYNNKPLLLLPDAILSPLPVANCFDDIDIVCAENQRVRDAISAYLNLGEKRHLSKADILSFMHQNREFRQALISAYKSYPVKPYDFNEDPAGEYVWLEASRQYTTRFPLALSNWEISEVSDVLSVTEEICRKFKTLIENNGLHALLYDNNGKPKNERAAQLLFFGIADCYCSANDIDLSREPNCGRGPVDFKLSRGSSEKVVVEIKLTSNNQLKHGVEKQLPVYMKQEGTHEAIYLIIDNGHPKVLENFFRFYDHLDLDLKRKIKIIPVDGSNKLSASNA